MFNMRVIDVTYLFFLLMGIQDIYSDVILQGYFRTNY